MNSEDFKLTPERLEEYRAAQKDAQKARWVTHMRSSDTSFADRLEGLSQDEQDAFTDRMYEIGLGKHRMMSSASHYAEGNKRMRAAMDAMPTADSKQVSGNHYKDMPIQPWAVMESVLTHDEFIGFLKGNVVKYSMRAGRKEGSDDAGKAKHYMEKLNEMQGSY